MMADIYPLSFAVLERNTRSAPGKDIKFLSQRTNSTWKAVAKVTERTDRYSLSKVEDYLLYSVITDVVQFKTKEVKNI